MPRFVAKEDVEKGLVDPTKPIADQPEYQKKLQSQAKKKQPKQEAPKYEKTEITQHTDKPHKHQDKQKKPKRERTDRPQFNWNRKEITLETKVPEIPKKLLPKPDGEKFRTELNKLKELKESFFLQRQKLIDEQRFLIKSSGENKKSGFNALSKYGLELKEKYGLRKSLFAKINELEDKRKAIEEQVSGLKSQNDELRKPKDLESMSLQQLKDKIGNLQQRLSSANLDKKQEAQINNNINLAKRALLKARPDIEIKTQLSKNDDKITIFYDELKTLRKQIDQYYKELKPLKDQIAELEKKRKEEEGVVTEVRTVEDIKAEYDKKIKEAEAKRDDTNKKMDELRTKYNKDLDLWEDQEDLLRYIKYVQEEIDYKRKRKEEDERRQKERAQREAKKKKQFEEREKRRQERIKQDEERKQREEERKLKLQAERDAFLNRNPNWQAIDLCEFMIKYCNNIKPDQGENKAEEKAQKAAEDINLAKEKGWEKEAKSGCQVILGKKSKLEEEAPKKTIKAKKPKIEDPNESINHGIETLNRFHELNILPPLNASEIDQTIKQLQEKIEILKKPSEEAIAAFKEKAAKEFDRLHGFHDEDHQDEEEKPVKHEKKVEKKKLQLQGSDFPELN